MPLSPAFLPVGSKRLSATFVERHCALVAHSCWLLSAGMGCRRLGDGLCPDNGGAEEDVQNCAAPAFVIPLAQDCRFFEAPRQLVEDLIQPRPSSL